MHLRKLLFAVAFFYRMALILLVALSKGMNLFKIPLTFICIRTIVLSSEEGSFALSHWQRQNHSVKIPCSKIQPLTSIFYYRPQTKFTKVMFSQVSVCPQGGVCPIACWDTPPQADTPPWADTPCTVHAGINKRAVRIPLECILVLTRDFCFNVFSRSFDRKQLHVISVNLILNVEHGFLLATFLHYSLNFVLFRVLFPV